MFQKITVALAGLILMGCSSAIGTIKTGGLWEDYPICPCNSFYPEESLSSSSNNKSRSISMAGPEALTAIDTAKSYLKKRGGNEFLKLVDLYEVTSHIKTVLKHLKENIPGLSAVKNVVRSNIM